MNNFDKKMEEIFDVVPAPEEKKENLPVVSAKYNEPELKQDLTDAYQQSKENLQGIIDQGKEAMEEILQVAKAGQHPRAFEVYGGILKNMVDANKELLNIKNKCVRWMVLKEKQLTPISIKPFLWVLLLN